MTLLDIRNEVLNRFTHLTDARKALHDAIGYIEHAGGEVEQAWDKWGQHGDDDPMRAAEKTVFQRNKTEGYNALHLFAEREGGLLTADILSCAGQIAHSLAKEIETEVKREDIPVVSLTGNSFMPPIRSYTDAERVFQADDNGDVWEHFNESLVEMLGQLGIEIQCPSHDNALFGINIGAYDFIGDGDEEDAWMDEVNWKRLDA